MEQPLLTLKYHLTSELDTESIEYYNRHIEVDVFEDAEEGLKLIGKVSFYIVYGSKINESWFSLTDVLDVYEYTFRHGQDIFNLKSNRLNKKIETHYDEEFYEPNICFIERMELLPELRGKEIMKRTFEDIMFLFGNIFDLVVVQPYPLQLENWDRGFDEWSEKLKLNDFPKDDNALKKLTKYYMDMGFVQIKGYKELLFLCPGFEKLFL